MMAPQRSIIFWNCNNLSNKFADLQTFTRDNKPLCIMLAETKHASDAAVQQLVGYTAVGKHYLPTQGGIILYVSNSLPFFNRRTDVELSDHVLAIELPLRATRLLLLACYHHEGSSSLPGILNSHRAAAASGLPLLSLGDFNAHHVDWGSNNTSAAGRQLAQLCDDLDLTVLNSVHCPGEHTFFRGDVRSVLDLALTSHPALIADTLPDSDIPLLSDHLPLRVELCCGARSSREPLRSFKTYDFEQADWEVYECESEFYFQQLLSRWEECARGSSQQQVDAAFNEFLAVSLACAERAVPLRLVNVGSAPRLPAHVLEKRDAWHRAYRNYQRNYSAAARAQMLRRRGEWRCAFKTNRSELHARRCERLDRAGPTEFWRHWARAHPRDRAPLTNVLDSKGNSPSTPTEALNNLAEIFASHCQAGERKHPTAEEKHAEQCWTSEAAANDPCDTDEPFSVEEVSTTCARVKTNTATGPDGLHNLFLKHLGPFGRAVLTRVGNLTLQLGALPAVWKQANIVPIYKRSGDRADPANYRGVSLTSNACKLFERMLDKRLRAKLQSRLSRWQAGFRSGYSTVDQLFRLRSAAGRAIRSKGKLPVAFLDISKAFDKTWYAGIMLKLQRMGVFGRAWAWIKAFLTDRSLRVVNSGLQGRWFPLSAGVPQGAVLSPLLFLVYINDSVDDSGGCDCALFADDVAIWPARGGSRGSVALQAALDSLASWAETWRLNFNVKKSAVVVFKAGRPDTDSDSFKLGKGALPFQDSYTYLGLVFAHNLDWRKHAASLVDRVRRSAFAITGMIHRPGSPAALSIRKLVSAICVPQVSYGMPIFRPDAGACAELDSLLAMPLKQALRLPKSSPVAAVLNEFGLLNTEHLCGKAALWFARRALTLESKHPTSELWVAEPRGAEQSEARRYEEVVHTKAMQLDNREASDILQQRQLNQRWDADDKRHEPPVKLLKWSTGPARYLALDGKEIASRRARLRFDRSGLRASLRMRRLVDSEECPDCKAPADTAEHVLLHCRAYDDARLACVTQLSSAGCSLDLALALGEVEHLNPKRQLICLTATARLLRAIDRVAARRQRR